MGIKHNIFCNNCSHQFYSFEGGGFKWSKRNCTKCNKFIRVPYNKPIFEIEDLSRDQLIKYLDSPGLWPKQGLNFSLSENTIINELIAYCSCGGSMLDEVLPVSRKCFKCNSTSVTLVGYGVCYD
jgi:hypothetical protein